MTNLKCNFNINFDYKMIEPNQKSTVKYSSLNAVNVERFTAMKTPYFASINQNL